MPAFQVFTRAFESGPGRLRGRGRDHADRGHLRDLARHQPDRGARHVTSRAEQTLSYVDPRRVLADRARADRRHRLDGAAGPGLVRSASGASTASHFDNFVDGLGGGELRPVPEVERDRGGRGRRSFFAVLSRSSSGYAFGDDALPRLGGSVLRVPAGPDGADGGDDRAAVLRPARPRADQHVLGADPAADRRRRSRSGRSGCARSSAPCRGRWWRRRGSTGPRRGSRSGACCCRWRGRRC